MIEKGIYRHFKGGLYVVLGIAVDAEPGHEAKLEQRVGVVYQDARGHIWYRTIENFIERVYPPEVAGAAFQGSVQRFTRVEK